MNTFNFAGIIGPDFMAGLAVVDLKYIANGFFYIYDIKNKKITETKKTTLPSRDIFIDPYPNNVNSAFHSNPLKITITNKNIYAKGKNILIDAELNPSDSNP